jgi:hypothetical protein
MITFFNRRELLMTCDPGEVNRVREILFANRIDNRVKVVNSPMGAGRNRVSFSRRPEQHIIYVHGADWEYARYLMRK